MTVIIDYTNHRGERSKRRIRPIYLSFRYMGTEHHSAHGWYLSAFDLDRNAPCLFAMDDIHSWVTEGEP
jgi:predicted DNA-binding transcriptional regulator YafY